MNETRRKNIRRVSTTMFTPRTMTTTIFVLRRIDANRSTRRNRKTRNTADRCNCCWKVDERNKVKISPFVSSRPRTNVFPFGKEKDRKSTIKSDDLSSSDDDGPAETSAKSKVKDEIWNVKDVYRTSSSEGEDDDDDDDDDDRSRNRRLRSR